MMALEADRLSFSYGEVPVLSCASFGLPQGGFAALIGPNGAGKSTLLKPVSYTHLTLPTTERV